MYAAAIARVTMTPAAISTAFAPASAYDTITISAAAPHATTVAIATSVYETALAAPTPTIEHTATA